MSTEVQYATSGLRFFKSECASYMLFSPFLPLIKEKGKAIGMVEPENRTWELTSPSERKQHANQEHQLWIL